jgi:CheY-like chemotaxis protein
MATILYVEDNEDNIYMLSNRLQREGFTVVIGRNGSDGVKLANEEQPDLIIMDLVLPEMDGFTAANQLRNSEQTRHIPIIALSASVLPEDQHKAIDAGCDDFETKPVAFPRLLEKIHHYLGKGSP